jgi:CRISPR-associated protein Csm2
MNHQRQPERSQGQRREQESVIKRKIEELLRDKTWATVDKAQLVQVASDCGKALAGSTGREGTTGVGVTQVRNIYDEFVRIRTQRQRTDGDLRGHLQLLKPRIAYAAGREKRLRDFADGLTAAIDGACETSDDREFEKSVDGLLEFVEAMVQYMSYHKAFTGGG